LRKRKEQVQHDVSHTEEEHDATENNDCRRRDDRVPVGSDEGNSPLASIGDSATWCLVFYVRAGARTE